MEGKTLTPEFQILSVASWLVVVTFLQLSLYPSLKKCLGQYAFPASFAASLLIFTIITWYCGLSQVPVQLALIPFLLLFGYHSYRHDYTWSNLKKEWKWELIFLIFFFLMLTVRFVNPTISYAEKFMDHGFLASIMRNPVVPPLDPWFAGGTMDVYYYLGYWLFGCLGIVSGVPSNIAFNLALPTVLGVAAVMVYVIGSLLLERFRWLPLLLFFIPNPSLFYQLILGNGLSIGLWNSTRTITNTINEYPLFSFTWGDLHAHVISIFNQVFLIFLLIYLYKYWESLETKGKWLVCGFIALSLGSMPLINTWDVLIYAPITVIIAALIIYRGREQGLRFLSWNQLIMIPPLSILFYLPFYVMLKTSTGGIAIVKTPSDPFQFLLANGWFIAIFLLLLIKDIQKRPYLLVVAVPFILSGYFAAAIAAVPLIYFIAKKERNVPEILAIFGLLILILVELFYLKDNMGDTYFRMNTVFKCYLPAWIILSISAFAMVGIWSARPSIIPAIPARKSTALAVLVVGFLFVIPFMIPLDLNYGGRTLDGLAYLDTTHPGDAGGVTYLRNLTSGNERIVEAVGGDYTYYSRISSFTGIPAILGESFHEFMWRGDATGWYGTRPADVRSIYENPDQTIPLMKKYNATLLYVGDVERETYNVSLPATGLEEVYSAQGTDIYRIAG
jgi:YYY domain-containing protein